mmetsp:Transcript_64733/g.183702  ORF Transcript_64733/g.183702 Transcript_64733/m.183702 type:complete len:285 (+) Transcript_64733:78-932(+)
MSAIINGCNPRGSLAALLSRARLLGLLWSQAHLGEASIAPGGLPEGPLAFWCDAVVPFEAHLRDPRHPTDDASKSLGTHVVNVVAIEVDPIDRAGFQAVCQGCSAFPRDAVPREVQLVEGLAPGQSGGYECGPCVAQLVAACVQGFEGAEPRDHPGQVLGALVTKVAATHVEEPEGRQTCRSLEDLLRGGDGDGIPSKGHGLKDPVVRQRAGQLPAAVHADAVALEPQLAEAGVHSESRGNGSGTLVADGVPAELELLEVGPLPQCNGDRGRAGCLDDVPVQVK